MSGWNSLSLREKAEMMKAAIKRGITNLSDIKQLYNDSLDIDAIEKIPTYEDLSYNGDLPPVDVTAQQMRNYANGGNLYDSGGKVSWKQVANRGVRTGYIKGSAEGRIKANLRDIKAGNASNNTDGIYSTPGNINLPAGSLSGNAAAQYAMKFFMDRGMTKYAAAGLVGNLMRESGLVPNAVNKSGKNPTYAYGIAQWLGPRRDALFAKYGSNPTLDDQLQFVWHELNTTHRSGLRALQNAKNYQDAMMAALGYYEFSAGPQGALRAILKTGQNADLAVGRGMQYAAQLMGMPNISNEDIQRIKSGYLNDRNFDMSTFGVAAPEAMSMQVPMENPNLSMWQPTVPEAFGMSSQPNMSGYVTKSEYDSINARLDEMAKMEQERQLAIQQEQEKAQKRAEREQMRNNALFAFNLMNNSFAPQSSQNNNSFFTPIAEANPAFAPFAMVGAYGGKLGKKFANGGSKGNYSYNRANAEEAMAYLMSEGFPRHTAAAIVGAGIRESGMNPYQHNLDGGKAYGLYQWLDQLGKGGKPVGPQRKSKLFEMYGKDAGLLPQMKYLVWEMNNVLPAWEREKILNAPDVPAAAKEFTYRFGSGQGNRSDAELRSYIASTGQDVDEAVRRAINYGNEMLDYYPDLNMWKQKWATESTSQPQDDTIIRRQTPQTDYLKPIDLNAPFQPDYNLMSTMMERPIYPYQGLYDSKAVVLPMSNTHVTDEGMLMDTRSGEQYTAAAPTLETTAPYNKEAFNMSGNVITPLIVKNNSATNNSFRRGGRLYDEGGNTLMTDLALLKSSEADRANNIEELSVLPDGTLMDRYGRYGTVALPDVVVEGQTNKPQVANFGDTMALYAKDKPLERIYPEFDILAAARGLLTGGLGYTLRTLADPKTYTRTADAVVNTARAMAKPGSNFWTNPLTKAIVYGTAAGETVNAGSEALTGRTWGENIGDWTEQLTGWNPNNNFFGKLITEGTNPGYIFGPNLGSAYNYYKQAINTSLNPKMQYVRYGLGKVDGWLHGYNPKLPAVYRKVKTLPTIENGRVQISTPNNRFAYDNGFGEDSPLITNMTTDAPVRSHPQGNWDRGATLSFPGKTLLGKNVISTRPSDTFTFGDNLSLSINDVTAITGRPKEIAYFKDAGVKTVTSPEVEAAWQNDVRKLGEGIAKTRENIHKINDIKRGDRAVGIPILKAKMPADTFADYSRAIEDLTRQTFKSPTIRDYAFMDYVFNPKYSSQIMPTMQTYPKLDILSKYPLFSRWISEDRRRDYLLDSSRWANVMYDPTTSAEADFRGTLNIGVKPH